VEIDWYAGPRAQLRHLFELAEDSRSQLDSYIDLGRVLLARRGPQILGHLQLIPMPSSTDIELKNMAVAPTEQGTGVGRALVETAIQACATQGWSRLLVATAAADTGNLRFYQRVGFRMLSLERNAFTADTGYPDPVVIDGIRLVDRVWLSQDLPTLYPSDDEPATHAGTDRP
jgi:GNAT superfamily N-acetyltransferase